MKIYSQTISAACGITDDDVHKVEFVITSDYKIGRTKAEQIFKILNPNFYYIEDINIEDL